MSDAPFELANLSPNATGLPLVVFVRQQGDLRDKLYIEVSPLPRYNPAEAITVTLESPPRALGSIASTDLHRVSQWIELNRVVIEGYWSGDIEYTEDMMSQIKAV